MRKEINILRHHGWQFVPDVTAVELAPLFRGRPVITDTHNTDEIAQLKAICPTNAIVTSPLGIDLGKCVLCKECAFAFPHLIQFTNDYKVATNDRNNLIVTSKNQNIGFNKAIIRPEIQKIFKHSLKLRQVSAAGDNSCEMELNACGNVNFDMGRFGIEFVASPRHADGIVITGPISANMAEALQITYDAVPEPKIVVLCGVDAISGGIFANSPALDRSFLNNTFIDLYIPGNPVHPLSVINGILQLINNG